MTDDSDIFERRGDLEDCSESISGELINTITGEVYLPLYQGIMISVNESNRAQWVSGHGKKANWLKDILRGSKIVPQYYVQRTNSIARKPLANKTRILVRNIGPATNWRTMVSAVCPPFPSGNSLTAFNLQPTGVEVDQVDEFLAKYKLNACLSSLIYDWHWKIQLTGSNQSWAFWANSIIPKAKNLPDELALLSLRLNASNEAYSKDWLLGADYFQMHKFNPSDWFNLTPTQAIRLEAIMNAIILNCYEVSIEDFVYMIRDCDLPSDKDIDHKQLDPKGFWRISLDKPITSRLPLLTLSAYSELLSLVDSDGLPHAITKFVGTTPTEAGSQITMAFEEIRVILAIRRAHTITMQ